MTEKQKEVILKSQQGELDAVVMYQKLAKKMKNETIKETLLQLAAEEGRHAAVFYKLSQIKLEPKNKKANMVSCLRYFIGWKLLFKVMAKGEYDAENKYISVVKDFPVVESVKNDEHRHGDILLSLRQQL